jgi:hypothetical protein
LNSKRSYTKTYVFLSTLKKEFTIKQATIEIEELTKPSITINVSAAVDRPNSPPDDASDIISR